MRRVKNDLSGDGEYKDLADWISGGCTGPPEMLPDHIRLYWRVRNKLSQVNMVPVLDDSTVVPLMMRGHQGVLGLGLRAEQAGFWPGFWSDIKILALCTR